VTRFRLLADDLTGALDSAARFCPRFGAVPVAWADEDAPVLALDCATRGLNAADARLRMAALAPSLAGAEIAFKKLDSLLRGHVAAELAVCIAAGRFDAVVIAPAFPAQGRITRHGRQLAHGSDVGVDLVAELANEGVFVVRRRPGDDPPPGVSLWDAETDADLFAVAAMARGRVLWCGTGGLAGALGGQHGPAFGAADGASLIRPALLERPILALVGSDHAVALAQFGNCRLRVELGGPEDASACADGAVVMVAMPAGIDRAGAARRIADTFAALLRRVPRPGTLVVVGGETLHGVCRSLDATGLVVDGEFSPGVPVSRLADGRWDGLRVVSKSGAFGDSLWLARMLNGDGT
jgi:uncharacterized protein YgbK (DUF1537 family)